MRMPKLEYNTPEGAERLCPICKSPLQYFDDGFTSLEKCFNCGYSKILKEDIKGQRHYDIPFNIYGLAYRFLVKKGFYSMKIPIDEALFNAILIYKNPDEAIKEVISDLRLEGDAKDYFLNKVKNLIGDDDDET